MVVLKTWPQKGALGSPAQMVSLPPRSVPATTRSAGEGKSRTARSSSSRTPSPDLAAATATGRNFRARVPADSPRRSSSSVRVPASR